MRHDVGAEFLTRAAGTMISEVSLLNGRVQIGGSVCPKFEYVLEELIFDDFNDYFY
jgi:hypothetical protein